MKVLLVASAGGHLQQLVWARAWWEHHERVWVTFDTPDARAMLAGERWIAAAHPTNRSVGALLRNARLARRVLREERPAVVVSTGAGVAVPFLWAAAASGIRTVYVEPYDRVDAPSLTARLVAPVVDVVGVQRRELLEHLPRAVFLGPCR